MKGKKLFIVIVIATVALSIMGCNNEKRDWDKAQGSDTVQGYETYLKAHPDGTHAISAKNRKHRLELQELPKLEGTLDGGLTMGFFKGRSSFILSAKKASWCLIYYPFPLERTKTFMHDVNSKWEVMYTNDTVFVGFDEKAGKISWMDGKKYRIYTNSVVTNMSDEQRQRMLHLGIMVVEASMIEVLSD